MAASDHLNGQQFMPVSDLLHTQSNDARVYKEYRPELGIKETTVQSTYARRAQSIAEHPDYQKLDEPIRSGSIDPVLLTTDSRNNRVVVEGHHRIVRAHQLGVDRLPVSFDPGSQRHRDDWDVDEPPADIDSVAASYWKNRGA